jgi:hypothetical protein
MMLELTISAAEDRFGEALAEQFRKFNEIFIPYTISSFYFLRNPCSASLICARVLLHYRCQSSLQTLGLKAMSRAESGARRDLTIS